VGAHFAGELGMTLEEGLSKRSPRVSRFGLPSPVAGIFAVCACFDVAIYCSCYVLAQMC